MRASNRESPGRDAMCFAIEFGQSSIVRDGAADAVVAGRRDAGRRSDWRRAGTQDRPLVFGGQEAGAQFFGPLEAKPRWSGSTTKVGRFSFAEPRRETHPAPAPGNPGVSNPVACKYVPWLCTPVLPVIEWINAISSTQAPSGATISLRLLPQSP